MMFYATVAGWMILYFFKMLKGDFANLNADSVANEFSSVLANPGLMALFMIVTVILCISICAMGLENGVEKITKFMMISLLILMFLLAVHSVFMENSQAGLE